MNILLFVIILLALILVHEFGHFIVAKKSGIRVDEFGIGFPPRAYRFAKKGETEYTLNWLPFGGFVKIFGENPDDTSTSGPDSGRSFVNKPKHIQIAVLAAGVIFNLLFAWFLFWLVFMIGSPTALSEEEAIHAQDVRLIVTDVLPDSPAAVAGLRAGDEISTLSSGTDSLSRPTPDSLTSFINQRPHEEITATIIRGNETLTINATPATNVIADAPEQVAVGISMTLVGLIRHDPFTALWQSAVFTYDATLLIGGAIVSFVYDAITLQANLEEIAGPVGIVGIVGDASALGFVFLLNFTAFISINLAIINLVPFPALDGGRILFVIIETIKGSPIRPAVANLANVLGFSLLILLMLLVTYNDILRLI